MFKKIKKELPTILFVLALMSMFMLCVRTGLDGEHEYQENKVKAHFEMIEEGSK